MSGIVGIINLDGAPIDRGLLHQMTEFIAYRGPDAQDIWMDGHVGFGHTMLRTTSESGREKQPCSLDGQVWITADARVDDRANLIRKLATKVCDNLQSVTDVELILHAYDVWGQGCVKHLIGDFAFAIWDGRRQRLFCARDHFGLKLFYYAQVANCLVLSNTLNCVRLHPAVSDELNDLAIGDFLLFDFNAEPATTTFADIQRLPPAHYITWTKGALGATQYWTFPIDGTVRYKQSHDYVQHFRELLETAVHDRLRTDRVGVLMSGGLDSTTLAAAACGLRAERSEPFDLEAHCVVYDRLIPDQERYYSGLAAKALGIPIHYLVGDHYQLYERWDQPEFWTPETCNDPLSAIAADLLKKISARSRVALSGDGGDELLCPSSVVELLRAMPFAQVAAAVARYALAHRRSPWLGLGIYAKLKRWLEKHPRQPSCPVWLNADFAARLDLPARWEQLMNAKPTPIHPVRPQAHQRLTFGLLLSYFESLDAGVTFVPLEVRLPFLDLRLVNYLMAIPPVPWCTDKELLREALRGRVPETVRQRRKTPLAAEPVSALLRQHGSQRINRFGATAKLGKYVDVMKIPKVAGVPEADWHLVTRPFCLNHWLQHYTSLRHKRKEGNLDEEVGRYREAG